MPDLAPPALLSDLRAKVAKATPPPYVFGFVDESTVDIVHGERDDGAIGYVVVSEVQRADAEALVAVFNAFPALLALYADNFRAGVEAAAGVVERCPYNSAEALVATIRAIQPPEEGSDGEG